MRIIILSFLYLILLSPKGFAKNGFTLFLKSEYIDFIKDIPELNLNKGEIESLYKMVSEKDKPIIIKSFESGVYGFQSCSFSIFKLEEGNWIDLYKGKNIGFNCYPKIFEYEGVIYSLGSYGY
jgi:hypothetical protein